MVKEEMDIVWTHIEQVKDADRNIGWSITRIPNDAVYLDNFTKMRVNLMEKVIGFKKLRYTYDISNSIQHGYCRGVNFCRIFI